MTAARDHENSDLEARAVEAHRAYSLALCALEMIVHEQSKFRNAATGCESTDKIGDARFEAELRKEACRIAFRDLINELGYIPKGNGIALPSEPDFDALAAET